MPDSPRQHAARDDNSGKTMCGEAAASVLINNGFPDCRRCLRAIARAIRERTA